MRRVLTLACMLVLFVAGTGRAEPVASSPMVEKQIFGSDADSGPGGLLGGAAKSPEALKLEKEISFTGVISSPEGKRAMIRETRRGPNAGEEKSMLKEGDEIKGMTIKEIGSNYLVLLGQGKEVRLHLYSEAKQRPAPPPEPKVPETAAVEQGSAPGQAPPGASGSGAKVSKPGAPSTPGTAERARRPLDRRTQPPSAPGSTEGGKPTGPPSNPFTEALKNAAQQQSTQGAQQSVPANNPFLEAIRRAQQGR